MAILGCNFDINFGQTLAPGCSLSNILRTCINGKFYSIMVESNAKSIWQHNLPMDFYGAFQMPSRRLDFWCLKGKKWGPPPPPETPKLKVREVSQSGFWNTSSHPASVPSFSQIGWPQLLAPRTLSQTVTLRSRARLYETWKQCQWIMGTLTCKHKISAENLFPMSLRVAGDINWWVISGWSSFLKELWSGF